MLLAMVGMLLFTRVGVDSSYASHVLPGLIVTGLGMGLVFAPAMATATARVASDDAGVASAMVNTAQQVGGSIGTALLSTFSTSAVGSYLASRHPNPQVVAEAAVHGYTTAFWWSAAIFLAGAVATGLMLRPGVPEVDDPTGVGRESAAPISPDSTQDFLAGLRALDARLGRGSA